MFADEARFGRMNRPRRCWAPHRIRPGVASQLIREYIHLYGAVCPQDGTCVYLIMPTSNTACFQSFLNILSRRFAREDILLVLDGAPNHRGRDLAVPRNITLLFLPPYAPELNPKENIWDEIREKIFKNYALKSIDAVYAKLNEASNYPPAEPGALTGEPLKAASFGNSVLDVLRLAFRNRPEKIVRESPLCRIPHCIGCAPHFVALPFDFDPS
jgi:transposase